MAQGFVCWRERLGGLRLQVQGAVLGLKFRGVG